MYKYHNDGTHPLNGEIFVFGSNLLGVHGAGAAKAAKELYGAEWGKGVGLIGQSYAIPTKDEIINTMRLPTIAVYVSEFVKITHDEAHDKTQWFVTRIGCGLAGYRDWEIAPMFREAKNCSFANEWKKWIEND